MAWSIVGVSTSVEVTTTTHTLTLPAGVSSGDLLVAVVASRKASTVAGTLPSGWTRVTDQNNNNVVAGASTGVASIDMFYVVHTGTTPNLTYTHPVAPSVALARVVAYRGGSSTPLDTQTSSTTATAITAVSVTGVTTTQADDLLVFGVGGGRAAAWSAFDAATDPGTASGATDTTTAPTAGTWIERADVTTATGADTSLGMADAIKSTAGATGNLTCTASLSGGQAVACGAFKIAPAGGGSTITQTGSTQQINFVGTGNTGTVSSTITVPADAELALCGVVGFTGTSAYFSGGSVTLTKGGADTAMTLVASGGDTGAAVSNAVWRMTLPDTGTNKSLKFDWAGSGTSGGNVIFSLTFWKGVDTSSPIRGAACAESAGGAPCRASVAGAQNGDLAVCFAAGSQPSGEGSATTWTSPLTTLSQLTALSSPNHDGAWASGTCTGALSTVGLVTDTNWDDVSITLMALTPASTGITGTLTETEDIDVSAFTGTVRWNVALATTEAADTAAFNGTVRWNAALATTEAPDTPSFTGTVQWVATLATREDPDGAAFTGDLGPVPISATLAVTEGADTASFTGTVQWTATLSTTEAPDVAAFTGTVFTPVTGTLATTEAADTTTITGTVRWNAALATTEAPDSPAFTGNIKDPISATLATTEAADSASFNGTIGAVGVTGTLATTETPDGASFTGGIFGTGTLAASEAPDGASFTGTVKWLAILNASEAPDVAAFTGNVVALTGSPPYSQAVLIV